MDHRLRKLAHCKKCNAPLYGDCAGPLGHNCPVEAEERESKHRWVSVQDRLPELGKLVLACNPKRRNAVPEVVYRDDDAPVLDWWWENLAGETWGDDQEAFSHWMPLPELPKGEE